MLIILSPSKSLDTTTPISANVSCTLPEFLKEAESISRILKKLQVSDLMELQGISEKLARTNVDRNLLWQIPFTKENARQAILTFNGDVYDGLQATSFSEKELELTQRYIRILSGLYGFLRPLDLIQAYRLEMGTKLNIGNSKDLYDFWSGKITAKVNSELEKTCGTLIDLASKEYSDVIDFKSIKGKVITPVFKEYRGNNYKIISFYAKRARGLMAQFIITNMISNCDEIKAFDMEGYQFNNKLSLNNNWVFTRDR